MGTFSVRVTVMGPQGQLDCDALVDTGSTYSVIPGQALRSIGARPSGRRGFRLADESRIERDVGPVTLRYEGEDVPVLVVFGDDAASPLLGATALESLSLAVVRTNERLTPVDALAEGRGVNQMGMFAVSIRVIGANGLAEDVDALVDAGANRTALPARMLRRLGVVPQESAVFRTAAEELVELETGEALVEFEGRRKTVPVVFNSDDARPLLGATMLETFHLAVDPVRERLDAVPGQLR